MRLLHLRALAITITAILFAAIWLRFVDTSLPFDAALLALLALSVAISFLQELAQARRRPPAP